MARTAATDMGTIRRLAAWRPAHGVLSVYVDIDPGDRGEGWRIELRNGLSEFQERARAGGDHELRLAMEATARHVAATFPPDAARLARGRMHAGFVEVTADARDRTEEWFAINMGAAGTSVSHAGHPSLLPLVTVLDEGRPRGIVLVSSERVHLAVWELGELDELEAWELEIFSRDWRERKAQKPSDPASGQGATASGHDQYGQRLEHNRARFLKEVGQLARRRLDDLGVAELVVFGDPAHARELATGSGEPDAVEPHNLIAADRAEVADRAAAAVDAQNRRRERALVERIRDEALGGTHGALGLQETIEALAEGRVEHLVLDAQSDLESAPADREAIDAVLSRLPEGGEMDGSGMPLSEQMIALALATSAAFTPVEGEAAEALGESDGVGALLRY